MRMQGTLLLTSSVAVSETAQAHEYCLHFQFNDKKTKYVLSHLLSFKLVKPRIGFLIDNCELILTNQTTLSFSYEFNLQKLTSIGL